MSRKFRFDDPDGIYFLSISTVFWIDIFTRREYKDILIDSLKHCTKEKGLILFAYVIMSNHIHLIVQTEEDAASISNTIRDFKKYTAMQIIKCLKENYAESRREWILWMMKKAGERNGNNSNYQFWQQNNHPIKLNGQWIDEKLEYIHQNPVEAGWTAEPHEYFYSSARNYTALEAPIKVVSVHDGEVI